MRDGIALAAEGDRQLEAALRHATALERQNVPNEDRRRAWQVVADVAGEKPIGSMAAERAEAYLIVIESERRRPETLRHLRASYEADVLRLKNRTMTLREFCWAYFDHAADLDAVGATPRCRALCPHSPPLEPIESPQPIVVN